ncbi:serine hydrolase domain-containing protein [Pseudonocardia sp. H11422]|uniref:serine hydrolase domain-containing protein n=1 Tax=Pseudonocardia sp. H11422 TaxID=2835866 RepID=UPI001BDD4855|nr:serine hydrolase domain-containing protein [Pseudonocardia sp. H11422]
MGFRRSGRSARSTVPRAGCALLLALALAGCGTPPDERPSTLPSPGPLAPPSFVPAPVPAFATTLRPALETRLRELRAPGAVVLVDVPGQGTWLTGLGVGDLDTGARMRVDDHVRTASVTKTFTATVVLQLVDEGRVRLDDPVATYVADVPNGATITVRDLLSHRSGLYNTTDDPGLNATLDAQPGKVWNDQELLAIAFSHPPVFAPGQAFQYTNTNYLLLGLIAEQAGGAPLRDLMAQRIFTPLAMRDTTLPARDDSSIPGPHQRGYIFGTNTEGIAAYTAALAGDAAAAQVTVAPGVAPTDATDWSPSYTYADGAAISTVRDLQVWARALATGALLSPATQAQRLQFSADGNYGLGIERSFGGLIGHNGAIPGFQTFVGYQPTTGATVIVAANLLLAPNTYLGSGLPADELARIIAQQLLPT